MRHAAAAQGRSNYPRLRLAVRPTHYEVLFVVFYPVKTHTDLQAPAPLPSSSRSFNKAVGVPPRRDACSTSARTSRHACRTTPYYIPDLNPPNRYSHQLSQASALLDPPGSEVPFTDTQAHQQRFSRTPLPPWTRCCLLPGSPSPCPGVCRCPKIASYLLPRKSRYISLCRAHNPTTGPHTFLALSMSTVAIF